MSSYKQKPELVPFGTRIAEKRAELGMKQEDLAASLGIGRPALAKIETGSQDMKIETLTKMCKILNTSADYFLHGASAKAMDVHLKTGLDDRSLAKLEKQKSMEDRQAMYEFGSAVGAINEWLSMDEFYTFVWGYVNFIIEHNEVMAKSAAFEEQKKASEPFSAEHREATAKIREITDQAEFIRWRIAKDTAKFIDSLLEVK